MKLVFIEGPGKEESIKKYLGSEYRIFPTKGHVRDLPAKRFAIDIDNNFEPTYEIIPDKKALVENMKNSIIRLPSVLKNDEFFPDFEYMEKYIKQLYYSDRIL